MLFMVARHVENGWVWGILFWKMTFIWGGGVWKRRRTRYRRWFTRQRYDISCGGDRRVVVLQVCATVG